MAKAAAKVVKTASSKPTKKGAAEAARRKGGSPAKAKKKKKKKEPFKIQVKEQLKNRIWVVGVVDTEDDAFVSLEHEDDTVEKLYTDWLAKHAKKCPNFIVSVYSSDSEMDPVLMMIQAT